MKSIIIILILTSLVYSQSTVYEIPFSSKGNEIELSVKNESGIKAEKVKVEVIEQPEWIKFEEESAEIKELQGGLEKAVIFKFSVEKEAPVKKETKIKFLITDKRGESWEKEITVEVSPPKEFKLYQNYPNPFNPSTKISYTIPALNNQSSAIVQLKIYDILGREVTTLVNGKQKSGYYEVNWNSNTYNGGLASGMYIYRLVSKYANGEVKTDIKKMLLMK